MKIAEIKAKLAEIEKTCPPEFRSFTHTYWIITKNVDAKIGTDFFENDAAIEKLDNVLFEFFETALADPIPAWRQLKPWKGSLINLWLGANAHVNYDLPRVLLQSRVAKVDYDKVDGIIEQSIPEILGDQFPHLPFTGFATWVTNRTMRRWRARAWQLAHTAVK